jgi:hypothetical protein
LSTPRFECNLGLTARRDNQETATVGNLASELRCRASDRRALRPHPRPSLVGSGVKWRIHVLIEVEPLNSHQYPDAVEANLVGTYPAGAMAGGGYVWDEVLEYRVWCHPQRRSADLGNSSDYYFAFANYVEAHDFFERTAGAEEPLALVRQREYIDEPNPGDYRHVTEERIAEWPVAFLRRPRRTANTIPDFLSPHAPKNRLDILRGLTSSDG